MTKADPPDWSYKSPEELHNAGVVMHPTGSCNCGNEGECAWCIMDSYRMENEKLKERWEDLKKWAKVNIALPLRASGCMGNGLWYPVGPYYRMLKEMEKIENAE